MEVCFTMEKNKIKILFILITLNFFLMIIKNSLYIFFLVLATEYTE